MCLEFYHHFDTLILIIQMWSVKFELCPCTVISISLKLNSMILNSMTLWFYFTLVAKLIENVLLISWICQLSELLINISSYTIFIYHLFIVSDSIYFGKDGKESACTVGDLGSALDWEDPLEKEMSTHSSILAWRIPRTKKSDELQSMGPQSVGHDWTTNAFTFNRFNY